MARDLLLPILKMLVGVGMVALLSLGVVDAIVILGDIPGLVRDDGGQDNKLVAMEGESQDIVCNVKGAKTPIRDLEWEKSKELDRYSVEYNKYNDGNLQIEGHFKIEKIAEDMDGMMVTCKYSMPITGGINRWYTWEAKVELVVLTLTIEASQETCRDGKGDLNLVLKEARMNRKIEEELEEMIKSRIEDIFGSNRINSFNSTYHVTLPFAKVISTKEIFEMESEMFIDGAPASCQMFRPADKIDQREIDINAALAAAADFMGTNHTNRSLLIGILLLILILIIIIIMGPIWVLVWFLNRKEEKKAVQYRILSDPEADDNREGNQSTQDLHITPQGPIKAQPQHEEQAGQNQASSFLTSQEQSEEEGKHMASPGGPQ